MKNKGVMAAAVALAVAQTPAMAQQTRLPAMEVLRAGDDNEALIQCGYRYSDAIEDAKSALRYNRIVIYPDNGRVSGRMQLTLHIKAIVPRYPSGALTNDCFLNIALKITQVATVSLDLNTNKVGAGIILFCENGGHVFRNRGDVAVAAAAILQGSVSRCISEAEEAYRDALGE